MVELDWPGLGIAEDHGGLGLGFLEVGIVVEELGRVVVPTPFLATVTQLAPPSASSATTLARPFLPPVAAGECHRHAGARRGRSVAPRRRPRPRPSRRVTAGCSTA